MRIRDPRLDARLAFIRKARELAPEAFNDLAGEPVEAALAVEALRARDPVNGNWAAFAASGAELEPGGGDRTTFDEAVRIGRALRTAIENWCERCRLTAGWCFSVAHGIAIAWARHPGMREARDLSGFDFGERAVFGDWTIDVGKILDDLEPAASPRAAIEEVRDAIDAERDRVLEELREALDPSSYQARRFELALELLVRFQLCDERLGPLDPSGTNDATRTRELIAPMAEYLGLELRPAQRGRPQNLRR